MSLKQKLSKKQPKIQEHFTQSKNFIFLFVCMYKMGQISQEAYKKCGVEIIDKGRYFWINRRDLEVESDYVIGQRFLINVIQKNKNTDMS